MTLSVVVPQTIQEYARCLDIHHRSQDICLHATVHGGKHKGRHEETIRQLVESACDVPHDYERRWILADCLEDADDGQAGLGDVAQIQRMIGDKLSEFRLMQEACRNSNRYLEFLKLQQDKYGLFLFLGDRPHVMDVANRQCKRCRLAERTIRMLPDVNILDEIGTRTQCGTSARPNTAGTSIVPRCCVRKVEPTKDGEPRPVIAFAEINEVPPPAISDGVLQPESLTFREHNIKRFFSREYWGPSTGKYATVYKRSAPPVSEIDMNPHRRYKFLFYVSEFLDWHIQPLGS